MGFLLSRRWVVFFALIVAAAWGAYALGQWQFHRLDEKRHSNHVIAANLAASPVPLEDLLAVGRQPDESVEWRRVTATGRWDDRHTLVVKYQTNDRGAPGADVATPLVTDGGAAVLVDRGWMPTSNNGDRRPTTPAVSSARVTVTGWVRVNATGDATDIAGRSTRALSSTRLAEHTGYDFYGGFLDLARQSPPPAHPLGAVEMPDHTGDGPHFFYGLQWWFFGVLAVFGFCYLIYDEYQRRREEQHAPDADSARRSMHPAAPPR